MNKTASLGVGIAMALGAWGTAQASTVPQSVSFCAYAPDGSPANFWTGSVCDETVTGHLDLASGAGTLQSAQDLLGVNWTVRDLTLYGPGTYSWSFNGTAGLGSGTSTFTYTFAVGETQIGATMLFDWSNTITGIVEVWDTTPEGSFYPTDWDGDGIPGGMLIQGPFTGASFTFQSAVPVPAAVWLFGSGLIGLLGVVRRRRQEY